MLYESEFSLFSPSSGHLFPEDNQSQTHRFSWNLGPQMVYKLNCTRPKVRNIWRQSAMNEDRSQGLKDLGICFTVQCRRAVIWMGMAAIRWRAHFCTFRPVEQDDDSVRCFCGPTLCGGCACSAAGCYKTSRGDMLSNNLTGGDVETDMRRNSPGPRVPSSIKSFGLWRHQDCPRQPAEY